MGGYIAQGPRSMHMHACMRPCVHQDPHRSIHLHHCLRLNLGAHSPRARRRAQRSPAPQTFGALGSRGACARARARGGGGRTHRRRWRGAAQRELGGVVVGVRLSPPWRRLEIVPCARGGLRALRLRVRLGGGAVGRSSVAIAAGPADPPCRSPRSTAERSGSTRERPRIGRTPSSMAECAMI